MPINPDVVAEATRLIEAGTAEGCTVRAIGGVAVSLHAEHGVHPALQRPYRDIDLVAGKKDGRRTLKLLETAGYEPNERFNAMNGGRRLVVYDVGNGRQLDVFVGEFEMCHKIPIARRLDLDQRTVPLAELLLTKLQVVHTNHKDVIDICAILLDHEVGEADGEIVNAAYVASLLAGDWGLWRTSRGTIETTRGQLAGLGLEDADREVIDARLTALWDRVEQEPKSFRWRSRAKIGDRSKWYEEPEEIGHRTLDAAEE
jgi:hypothetical protein